MEILFIAPNIPSRVKEYLMLPSLELTTMSAMLIKSGHSTNLLDMRINDYSIENLQVLLKNYNFDLICIDGTAQTHFNVIKVIKECKRLYSNIPIILRGEIATFLPYEMLKRNPDLDFVMMYENEITILELVSQLEINKNEFKNIFNLAYRKDNKIIVNSIKEPIKDLDDLPFPNRNLYDMKKYLKRDSETIVRSSRGCPGKCDFCIKTKLSPFRLFSISRFCDEIEELIKNGYTSFFFSDDTFAFSDRRLDDFYFEVKRRNLKLKWTSNIRIKDINEDKIRKMKEIGAYRVFIGVETINHESSALVNKYLTTNQIIEKTEILKKNNIEFHASFIIGNPGDTEKDMFDTEKFMKVLNPTIVTFNKILLLPGTDIYNNPEKYDLIMNDKFWFESENWSYCTIFGTKQLPPEKVEYWSRRLLRSYILFK